VVCGAFVSATPCVCDFDGDGQPEILVGDWGGRFHALRLDGTQLPGFPIDLGFPIWSSAAAADIDGDGEAEAVVATRWLHAVKRSGRAVPGFPRLLGTYAVGSPIVVDLQGDGRAAAVVGSDKLYAFDGAGNPVPGFPKDVGSYFWASPVAARRRGGGPMTVCIGAWDGRLYAFTPGADPHTMVETQGPIFGAAGISRAADGGTIVAVGSWDGRVYFAPAPDLEATVKAWPTFHRTPTNLRFAEGPFEPPATEPTAQGEPPSGPAPHIVGHRLRPSRPRHRTATFVDFEGDGLESIAGMRIVYTVGGESREHPSPAVAAAGRVTSLIQPLGVGRVVRFHLEGDTFRGQNFRYPLEGDLKVVVSDLKGLPVGGLIARLEGNA
jgi:hypothetical protein